MNPPLLHRLNISPEQLPPVAPSELVKAWKAAVVGAEMGLVLQSGDIEGVAFATPRGETRFLFADLDASCWAAALDRLYGLDTLRGIAVLFRLLALIDIMGRAEWLRPLFTLAPGGGTELDPNLVHTASTQPLSGTAQFDAPAFRQRLNLEDEVLPASQPRKRLAPGKAKGAKPAKPGRAATTGKGRQKG